MLCGSNSQMQTSEASEAEEQEPRRPSRKCFYSMRFAAFLLLSALLSGAEYQGQNVDGTEYIGFVRSLQTGKYYPATVVFNQERATVRLKSGQWLQLTLDEPQVDDPEEVIAIDPMGRIWALSIDGLDSRSSKSEGS